MATNAARVSESGSLELPAEIGRAVGLEHGGEVMIELAGQEIHIRNASDPIAAAKAVAQELRRLHPDLSPATFLRESRDMWLE